MRPLRRVSISNTLSGLHLVHGRAASSCHSTSLPFCLRFNDIVTDGAARLDTSCLAQAWLGGIRPRWMTRHFLFAPHARVGWSGWDRAAPTSAPASTFAPRSFAAPFARDDVDFRREARDFRRLAPFTSAVDLHAELPDPLDERRIASFRSKARPRRQPCERSLPNRAKARRDLTPRILADLVGWSAGLLARKIVG